MNRVKEIKESVQGLSDNELHRFRQWFKQYDHEVWDEELQSDIDSGKLDHLADRAITDYENGETKEF